MISVLILYVTLGAIVGLPLGYATAMGFDFRRVITLVFRIQFCMRSVEKELSKFISTIENDH